MTSPSYFLIGARAVGKTTVGKALAHRLGRAFHDTDELITSRAGLTIKEMVSRYGWDYFRDLEKRVLAEVTLMPAAVIATGGGAIMHRHQWHKIRHCGHLVIWLAAPVAVLRRRLADDGNTGAMRPSLTGGDAGDELAAVVAERTPLYSQTADLRVDVALLDTERIVADIVSYVLDKRRVH